jgi:hypothetical protein
VESIDGFDKNFTKISTRASFLLQALQMSSLFSYSFFMVLTASREALNKSYLPLPGLKIDGF